MKKLLAVLLVMFATTSYADTETVTWYKDGAVYDTTTCQTGDDIIVPSTTPTKRGYVFNGWVFVYDFSTLDPTVQGTSSEAITGTLYWTSTFSYGTIYGRALCSATPGTHGVVGTPDQSGTGDRKYCWCQATSYIPNGTSVIYENMLSSPPWVNTIGVSTQSDCNTGCKTICGTRVRTGSAFRRAIFGITQ